MDRRTFIKKAGVATGGAVAATTLAAPAIAQSTPELKWRLASSFPKSLDTIYGGAETFAKYVSEATDGKFRSSLSRPASSFRRCRSLDKVQDGTVEMGHTALYYYWGKDPTFGFGTAVPFGLNCRLQNAWWYARRRQGGAERVLRRLQHPCRRRAATPARRWAAGSARRSSPSPT